MLLCCSFIYSSFKKKIEEKSYLRVLGNENAITLIIWCAYAPRLFPVPDLVQLFMRVMLAEWLTNVTFVSDSYTLGVNIIYIYTNRIFNSLIY